MASFAFRIALVYASLGYAIFFLGLTGQCIPSWVELCAAGAVLSLFALIRREYRARKPLRAYAVPIGSAFFLALLFSYAFFIPPYSRDDMIYHLLIPKQMAMTGKLAFDPFNAAGNFPMLFEMPLAAWLTLRIPLSPFLFNASFAVLLLAMFQAAIARIEGMGKYAAAALTLALATTPVLVDLIHTCYVEIFFALLINLATLFYIRTLEKDDRKSWFMACACLGLAAAVKYPGVLFAGFFFCWEFFRSRDRKALYAGAFICASLAAPWYIKNWIWTGNPVFPLANTLFSSPWISPLRSLGIHHMLADYHMGRAPLDYALLPFRLALGIDEARPGLGLGFDGKLSLLFALALCGLGWKDKSQRFVTLLFAYYFLIWTVESQQVRFLLAILALPIPYALCRIVKLPGRSAWVYALAAVVLAQNAVNVTAKLRSEKILPLLTGDIDKRAFLSMQMPVSYGMAGEINEKLDAKRDKLMTVGCFGRNYYFNVPVLTNTYYDQEIFRAAFERSRLQPDSVSAFLKRQHVTYILFNWGFVRQMHSRDDNFDMTILEGYLNTACPPVNETGGVVLYHCK